MRSSKSRALASRSRRVYCRKISRNITSCGSLVFTLRAYDSTSASSFLSFEIFAWALAGVNPSVSASSSLMMRFRIVRWSAES